MFLPSGKSENYDDSKKFEKDVVTINLIRISTNVGSLIDLGPDAGRAN